VTCQWNKVEHPPPSRVATAARRPNLGLGRRRHGLCRMVPVSQLQVGDSHRGRQILEIGTLRRAGSPLHGHISRPRLLHQHRLVSDRDPVFMSQFWTKLFSLIGVKLHRSFVFHPQTDGQSEATNKIITMYLQCLVGNCPRQCLQ
jgi:hypothetical protein